MNGVTLQRNGLSEILSTLSLEDMKWAVDYLKAKIKAVRPAATAADHTQDWRAHNVSPEVMRMTFRNRKNVSGNYKEDIAKALEEKYT